MKLPILLKADLFAGELILVNLGLDCFKDALLLSIPVNDRLGLVAGESL